MSSFRNLYQDVLDSYSNWKPPRIGPIFTSSRTYGQTHMSPAPNNARKEQREMIQNSIVRIHRAIRRIRGDSVTPTQLRGYGIRTELRPLDFTGQAPFSPCFFIPQRPNFTRCSSTAKSKTNKSEEGSVTYAGAKIRSVFLPNEHILLSPLTLITFHRDQLRKIIPPTFLMSEYTALSHRGAVFKGKWKADPALDQDDDDWRSDLCFEDLTHKSPHAIVEMITDAEPFGENLLSQEIRLIMRTLEVRMSLRHNQEHVIMPLLVISYIGVDHGRILHVHHNGTHVIIQRTQILDLTERNSPNIELFLRYYCSSLAPVTNSL